MYVGDGVGLSRLDQQLEPGLFTIYSADQLIRALNHLRQNGTIYVKLFRRGEGMVARGHYLPALPPSMLGVFGGTRAQGGALPTQFVHYLELSLGEKDYVASGTRLVTLQIEPAEGGRL